MSAQPEILTLWRPARPEERGAGRGAGIAGSRLRKCPISRFVYPALNEEYATMIARDWNARASDAGYVTRVQVRKSFLDRCEIRPAGGKTMAAVLDLLQYSCS